MHLFYGAMQETFRLNVSGMRTWIVRCDVCMSYVLFAFLSIDFFFYYPLISLSLSLYIKYHLFSF